MTRAGRRQHSRAVDQPEWVRVWRERVAETIEFVGTSTPHHVPEAIVSLATRTIPGCAWASLLFPSPHGRPPVARDAASSPVMVGVLAADATTRRGPLRSLTGTSGDVEFRSGLVHISDVGCAPRWQRFATALELTSPGVQCLTYMQVGRRDAVLVLAAPTPGALDAVADEPEVVRHAVHGVLSAAGLVTTLTAATA